MARPRIGDKPLSEQVLTQFTDAYMRHWGEISQQPLSDTGIEVHVIHISYVIITDTLESLFDLT